MHGSRECMHNCSCVFVNIHTFACICRRHVHDKVPPPRTHTYTQAQTQANADNLKFKLNKTVDIRVIGNKLVFVILSVANFGEINSFQSLTEQCYWSE